MYVYVALIYLGFTWDKVMPLTLVGTSWVPHPCLGSRTGRQPGLSLQTGQRSRSCSWIEKQNTILKRGKNLQRPGKGTRTRRLPLQNSSWNSLHSLLEHRVTPGLADDDISPLHNYNTDKEGCVACELHNLPLLICLMVRESRRRMKKM